MQTLSRRLRDVAIEVKPDILHAHSPVLNVLPALRVGRQLGIPVVYELRAFWEDAAVDHGTAREWGVRYRLTRTLETYALKRVDAITTICEGIRQDLVRRRISADRITVIPNAVDPEYFNISTQANTVLRRALGMDGKTVLGFIGSFYAYEGLDLLIRMLPLVLQARPDVRVLLVGGGPQEGALKDLTRNLALEDKVVFTGRVPHDQVVDYYGSIDMLVYPRLPMRLTETVTPLKPLEAMAQGHLVLASDVGGHRELIQPGRTGILFQPGSTASLADAVLKLLASPGSWDNLKTNARLFVERERTWQSSVARYSPVYAALVNGR